MTVDNLSIINLQNTEQNIRHLFYALKSIINKLMLPYDLINNSFVKYVNNAVFTNNIFDGNGNNGQRC